MNTIANSFTAVGNGDVLQFPHRARLTYDVSGTFVGTVILERSVNGGLSWESVASKTAAASDSLDVETRDQQPAIYRFRCSAFTSGTIVTSITEVATIVREFKDKTGQNVLTVKDDGIHTVGSAVDTPPLT
jgi:hypothetical protein